MLLRKLFLLVLIVCCALTGCMSAQYYRDRRIAENPELFNSFSPQVREQISLGQINIGFTEDMVRLAWGPPDRIYIRTTDRGEATVWTYSSTRILTQTDRMSVPVRIYDDRGHSTIVYRNVWVNRDRHEEYDVARVEFSQGAVSAIERMDQ
ncbi:MAG: hypothetical protein C4531_00715 [Desulfurivibrio sp.]|jgi:hypothetical protein|nr:MAG: hypothetical protein C4531_00715 [Desulfurivibrio sp.]